MKKFITSLFLLGFIIGQNTLFAQIDEHRQLIDSLNKIKRNIKSNPNRANNQFVYDNICGCNGTVKLNIYKGLDDPSHNWGGDKVPNFDKYTLGSVTVANLNDTDGDSIVDNLDTVVIATSRGVDELDLMKLEVIVDGKFSPNCNKIKLVNKSTNSCVKLWRKSSKEVQYDLNTEITLQPANTKKYKNELIQTLWVEACDVSTALRDIIIVGNRVEKDTINGITTLAPKDSVSATAIWVRKKNVYYDSITKIPLPVPALLGIDQPGLIESIDKDGTQSNHGFRAKDGSRYGFGSFAKKDWTNYYTGEDLFYGGRILFEFEIFPHEICNKLNIYDIIFDITRRKDTYDILYNDEHHNPKITKESFPIINDISNDDTNDLFDEDKTPSPGNHEIFSYDSPSVNRLSFIDPIKKDTNKTNTFVFRNLNFSEFVRISLKSQNLEGDSILRGSRCSNNIDWLLSSASYNSWTYNSSNPLNPIYQYSEVAKPGATLISTPRILFDLTSSNAGFDIKALGIESVNHAYALKYTKADSSFLLAVKRDDDSGWNTLINKSSVLSNGNWTIKYPTISPYIRIDIYKSTIDFNDQDEIFFTIKKIPSTILNKIKLK